MKKIRIFLASSVIILLASCGAREAADFNNKLVNLQKDLLTDITKIKSAATVNSVTLFTDMKAVIKTKLSALDDIKTPSGGDDFKSAMHDDFVGLDKEYDLEIKMLNPDLSETDRSDLTTEISTQISKLSTLDENVLTAQKKYASAHNVKLQ